MSDNKSLTSFAQLQLSSLLLDTLKEINYHKPSPIQAETIPILLEGRDVIAQAQTGTGKTAAFALPLLEKLDRKLKHPQILVLAPTRELALQVSSSIKLYSKRLNEIKVACICGGQEYRSQLKLLKEGVQIVVGTPGRIMDHINRGSLTLDKLQAFVLDEADEMLRMGFIEDVEWILTKLPNKRQMALFSATMPSRIRTIAQRYLDEPKTIEIKSKTSTVSKIYQRFLFASMHQKNGTLLRILMTEKIEGVIVFVRTKGLTEEVCTFLIKNDFKSKAIHGDINQKMRNEAVDDLKSGKIDILVATDVAARGLDIDRISHVINYDIPFDAETYIHRIGRTGRAGRSGNAILFVTPKESKMLNTIERSTKQKMEKIKIPDDKAVKAAQIIRIKEQIKNQLSIKKTDYIKMILKELMDEEDYSPIDIASAVASILWKEPQNTSKLTKSKQGKYDGDIKKGQRKSTIQPPRESFRIEVGKKHGVKPGNIIGAIANEAGLEGRYINNLVIYDDHSTVSLPKNMPNAIFKDLKKTYVCGKKLDISRY